MALLTVTIGSQTSAFGGKSAGGERQQLSHVLRLIAQQIASGTAVSGNIRDPNTSPNADPAIIGSWVYTPVYT